MTIEEDSHVDEIMFEDPQQDEKDDVLPLAKNKRVIVSQPSDERVAILHDDVMRGKLLLQPTYQRQYVWDRQKATSLIESALMGIPLPVVYFAEEENGKKAVIDGQQRLTSFFSFIEGKFPNGKIFKLGKMQVFPEYNGRLYKELPEEMQDRIRDCNIRTITFKKESDPDLKFNVFERLNTGAVSLNDQELRNCIYRGKYNDLLRELAEDPEFKEIVGIAGSEKRMKDVELVLRYCAFLNLGYTNYQSPIKKFLNKEMRERAHISDEKIAEIRKCFKNSVSLVKSMLGPRAFRRYVSGQEGRRDGEWEANKFNVSLFDILMVCFAREDKNRVMHNLDALREAYIDMQTADTRFMEFIRLATSTADGVVYRFDAWRKRILEVLQNSQKQPRCFSAALKRELYDHDPTCSICGQRIATIDDAAVDHIEQYWTGGETIPENARLTHRYCNWARAKGDKVFIP